MIEPLDNNPQTQPITTALKNICRDYPAGGGVLRELLQNADDAGALYVRFVLDPKHYPTKFLVNPGVEDLQGPALLAYNDSTFSQRDFASLSRIGDSCKQQDGSTTGKFGRGFNAVYNWTDSPSIVSRDRLLILEPHHIWTKHYSPPGGPLYSFVNHAKAGDIKDQMMAFSAITTEFDKPFEGTIIRIPLRTPEQAQKSKICEREASFKEVADVMQKFANDFGHSGLLFMKNVSKIRIEIGDQVPIVISIENYEKVREHKVKINEAIKKAVSGGMSNFTTSFEVEIKSGPPDTEQKFRFAVHHSIQNYPEKESLRGWSKAEAMVPWVAVASEIGTNEPGIKNGSLFNVLPSPIRISQPVHIHGCFSMSPDRAQLHGIGDSSVQYPLPGEWNHWLFEGLIPIAWANLLDFLAKQLPNQPAFGVWPKAQEDVNNTLHRIDQRVMQIIERRNYRVWHTDLGYIDLDSGLVAKIERSVLKRKAFATAGVPIIYLPDDLKSRVETTCRVHRLSPQTTCDFLERNQERLRQTGEDMKQVLLDYVVSDPSFRGYGAVELFPFEDGKYMAINKHTAFIHRSDDERCLFERDQEHNIDLQKLSTKTYSFLQHGCPKSSLHLSLRNRSTQDLRVYCQSTHFKTSSATEDRIFVDDATTDFISSVWKWLVVRKYSILDKEILPLWLIPLSDGTYRKIKPSDSRSNTLYAAPGILGDFLVSLAGIKHAANKPIIQVSKLAPQSIQLLKFDVTKDSNLLIKTSESLEGFLFWLYEIRKVLETVTPIEKLKLHKLVASNIALGRDRKSNSKILSSLKIFMSMVWKPENDQMVLNETWVSLDELPSSSKIGLCIPELTPNVGSVVFLDAQNEVTEQILSHFGLAKCPGVPEIVKRFMIPFWQDEGLFRTWTKSGKDIVSESIFRNFYSLDENTKSQVVSLPVIPVQCSNGRETNRFRKGNELIDPTVKSLVKLFFEDEEVFPASWVWDKYDSIMFRCGLRRALDHDIAIERIRCFAQRSQDIKDTSERATKLLGSSVPWRAKLNNIETITLQEMRWLPTTDTKGVPVLKNSRECRGADAAPLVGFVFPTLEFMVLSDWSNQLGWNSDIPKDILLEQLKSGILRRDLSVVNAVLKYMDLKYWSENLRADLLKLECIVASNSQLIPAQSAFRIGCSKLQPYAYNVEKKFWSDHSSLLKKLGVPEKPVLNDLIKMQNFLPVEEELDECQVSVAIEIVKLASAFPKGQLSSLKVVDDKSKLRKIEDITFQDRRLLITTGTFHSTHPDIPKSVIDKLPIEYLSVRVKRSELGITDDDEFDQHEDRVSAISDALNRYTIESTFKEFLANAEDCKDAKELHWLLDERSHPKNSTITEELGELQGPALLVHNDGVFREEDFEGLKRVGAGSKRADTSTIGKFGRGSQTMYHWTDVPMLLSGSWLVILDTERRKAGLKIQISRLKDRYIDQLIPFEGLWGFSLDLDYYPGTIFRFPLRTLGSKSKLIEGRSCIKSQRARDYLDGFLEEDGRTSLLFLRRIQYMDFSIYGEKDPRWSIRQSAKGETFSGWIECRITKCMKGEPEGTHTDRWRVAMEDLDNVRSDLQYRHQLTKKDTSCGIAALVPSPLKQKPIFAKDPTPKFFSSLPLPFGTNLPVHIHATFILASDRASMPVEDSMREDGAEWNKWLLSEALPRSYLNFLSDIGRELLATPYPYKFWPQKPPPPGHLSESIYTAFWQMLRNDSYQVFPLKLQIRLAKLGKRVPPKLVSLTDAVFDFFPEFQSTSLSSVLEYQITNLVRPPSSFTFELTKLEADIVTPETLLTLFKGEDASECLKLAVSKSSKALECLFSIIDSYLADQLEELDGCRILPLADGNLGTLRLSKAVNQASHYFLASAEELELFDFASSILVSPENPGKLLKKKISDSLKFNLSGLDLLDMKTVLKMREFGNIDSTEEAAWLIKFWKYCRTPAGQTSKVESYLETCDFPIFEATCNGIKSYVAPAKLERLPAVIGPQDIRQMSLCHKFPGIYILNASFLPAHLAIRESSLAKRQSFVRFIAALSKLAVLAHMKLAEYIKEYLDTDDIKVLQELSIIHILKWNQLEAQPELHLVRSLPIWPSQDKVSWLNAVELLATRHSGLLLPWMRDYNRFIDCQCLISNTGTLVALGVSEIPISTILPTYILPHLPNEVLDLDSHVSLLLQIFHLSNWKEFVHQLRQKRLALDQTKSLRFPYELYDHEDAVFTAAFRGDQQKLFLHPRLETMRSSWLALGLRQRKANGQFEPKDYISCLIKMRNRLETCQDENLLPRILADAKIILQPLTTPSTALDRFGLSDWTNVINQATFPVQKSFQNQPPHRQAQMIVCAAETPLLKLYNIVDAQYLSICWSQIPTPTLQPTVTTLAHLNNTGKPSASIVWRHIQYMANQVDSIAESSTREFLSDLYEAYGYLQDNLEDSKRSFTAYQRDRLWFNLELTDSSRIRKADLISSRCAIENLILDSSCDTSNLKSVRQGLFDYKRLLKALHCKSIVYPSVDLDKKRETRLIYTALDLLRKKETLIDLTLKPKVGVIRAHKVVMAAASEYFRTRYKREWADNDVIDLERYSYSTLSTVVDFAYKDAFNWTSMQLSKNETDETTADKLDDLLELLDAAEYLGMPNLKDQVEIQILTPAKFFIRESNVIDVRKIAEDARAFELEKYCKEFYENNREAVELAVRE